jgi:hypothetical protein
VSNETIGLGLNNPLSMYLAPGESRVKIYDATKRRPVNVKWRLLKFSRFLSFALKFSANATNHAGVVTCDIPLSNTPRNANHHSPMNSRMPAPW